MRANQRSIQELLPPLHHLCVLTVDIRVQRQTLKIQPRTTMMIQVAHPEALMRLSAMLFSTMRNRASYNRKGR